MGHRCLLGSQGWFSGETHRSQVGVNWQPQTPSEAKIRIAEHSPGQRESGTVATGRYEDDHWRGGYPK